MHSLGHRRQPSDAPTFRGRAAFAVRMKSGGHSRASQAPESRRLRDDSLPSKSERRPRGRSGRFDAMGRECAKVSRIDPFNQTGELPERFLAREFRAKENR